MRMAHDRPESTIVANNIIFSSVNYELAHMWRAITVLRGWIGTIFRFLVYTVMLTMFVSICFVF